MFLPPGDTVSPALDRTFDEHQSAGRAKAKSPANGKSWLQQDPWEQLAMDDWSRLAHAHTSHTQRRRCVLAHHTLGTNDRTDACAPRQSE